MFSSIKRFVSLWKKVASEFNNEARTDAPSAENTTNPAPATATSESAAPAAAPALKSRSVPTTANLNGHIALPLRSILARMSPDCMRLVRQLDVGDALVFLPTAKVLEQIPKGAVKITFAELKKASPPGVFSSDTVLDKTLVDLPLQDIIARLDPSLLARRSSQQQLYVPADVAGPFGDENKQQAQPLSAPASSPVAAAPAQSPASRNNTAHFHRTAAPALVTANGTEVLTAVGTGSQTTYFTKNGVSVTPPLMAEPVAQVSPVTPSAPVQPVQLPVQAPVTAQAAPEPAAAPVVAPAPRVNSFNTAMISRVGTPLNPNRKTSDLIDPLPDVFSMMAPSNAEPEESLTDFTPAMDEEEPMTISAEPVFQPESLKRGEPIDVISPIAPEPLEAPAPIRFQFPTASTAAPTPPAAPVTPISPIAPSVPNAHVDAPVPTAALPTNGDGRTITVSIGELSVDWPPTIQLDIAQNHLAASLVAFPFAIIQVAIKQGKVALPWRIIRSWVKTSVPLPASPNDAVILELPLKVITPLFLAELKGDKTQRKVVIDKNIPDLFSGKKPSDTNPPFPAAVAKPAASGAIPPAPLPPSLPVNPAPARAVATPPIAAAIEPSIPSVTFNAQAQPGQPAAQKSKVADTNYFSKPAGEEVNQAVVSNGTKPPTLGTTFLHRYATPNEIVSKAAALDGVEGALVALPDGLLVASQIPSNMNAHTIAAFLPQMFGRVSQCTKELRLGDLNNLSFTVGVVPWKIFKVGSIYFAAFGREGEQMPTAQLAGIAAELDRNAKQ